MAEQSFEYHARRGRRAGQDVDPRRAGRRQGARPAVARGADAVHLQACRGHARRPCRHRRDRRLGDPDQGRGHSGRGRRRHRLRHDGGAHLAARRATCPTIWRAIRARDRAGGAARPRRRPRQARQGQLGRPAAGDRRGLGDARRALQARSPTNIRSSRRRTTSSISARSAPATTSSSSASTRRTACG